MGSPARCYRGSVPRSEDVRIRRIGPADASMLRELRLRSIADSPDAFGQPLQEARARPPTEWRRHARQASHGHHRTWLIAEGPAGSVGLVQGRRRPPSTLLLFSMWVAPSARRAGVGRRLVEGLEDWGRRWRASETVLWVMGANLPALDFYRDLGFEPVRDGRDADSGARFGAVAMRRPIGHERRGAPDQC